MLRTPKSTARNGFFWPACNPGANTALPTVTPSGSEASPTSGSEKAKSLHTLAEVKRPRSSRSRVRLAAISCDKEPPDPGVKKLLS